MPIITDIGELPSVTNTSRSHAPHLAVARVSMDGSHADEILAHVLRFIERSAGEAQVTDVATELIRCNLT